MKTQGAQSPLVRYLKAALLLDLGIFPVTALVCWVIGARSLQGYGSGLLVAGGLTMAFGVFSLLGSTSFGSDWSYRYSQWPKPELFPAWGKQNVLDLYKSGNFMVLLGIAGFISLTTGLLILNILKEIE